ncbi:flavodoxin family protein [Romboutsia lituseburensis]|uniref:flavodoxin family protein n=1 Tax=Romboutsia lituseburensis TaxID=1537 RepID=UPI0022EB662D|nr:flavodoxin family protein [Romboutsia lituseburensis]
MKKIFIYIGSRAGRDSSTYNFIIEVLNKAIEDIGKENVKVDLYTASSCKINNCKSCNNCFFNGECPQDKSDDMAMIKSKMLSSDLIILASPVYLHNVSGDMKVFIDRISYWSHLLRLSGKAGIVIATSTGNGLDLTANYLHKVITYMGIKALGTFGVVPYYMNKEIINSIENCANIIKEYLNGMNIQSDNSLELIFEANKLVMESQSHLDTVEYKFWKESGLIKCNSFEEVLSGIKNNKVSM